MGFDTNATLMSPFLNYIPNMVRPVGQGAAFRGSRKQPDEPAEGGVRRHGRSVAERCGDKAFQGAVADLAASPPRAMRTKLLGTRTGPQALSVTCRHTRLRRPRFCPGDSRAQAIRSMAPSEPANGAQIARKCCQSLRR